MKKPGKVITLLFIAVVTTSSLTIPAYACGSGSKEMDPEILVKNTEIIVRATASGYAESPVDGSWIRFIKFRVEEVLKGENVPNTFLIRGFLMEKDDFNDRPVPYDYVRPMGRGGSCSARHYKQGAEFLLFLRKHDPNEEDSQEWGAITPYWASMAATNEQLRSSDDAWLLWVKEQLRKSNEQDRDNLLSLSTIRLTTACTRRPCSMPIMYVAQGRG